MPEQFDGCPRLLIILLGGDAERGGNTPNFQGSGASSIPLRSCIKTNPYAVTIGDHTSFPGEFTAIDAVFTPATHTDRRLSINAAYRDRIGNHFST